MEKSCLYLVYTSYIPCIYLVHTLYILLYKPSINSTESWRDSPSIEDLYYSYKIETAMSLPSGSKRWLLKKLAPQKSWKTKNRPKTGQNQSEFDNSGSDRFQIQFSITRTCSQGQNRPKMKKNKENKNPNIFQNFLKIFKIWSYLFEKSFTSVF